MIFDLNYISLLLNEHSIMINCFEVRLEGADYQIVKFILDLTGRELCWHSLSYRVSI